MSSFCINWPSLNGSAISSSSSSLWGLQDEVERMTYIFADPKKAMELFVQRVFEERIKPAVERSAGDQPASSLGIYRWGYHAAEPAVMCL